MYVCMYVRARMYVCMYVCTRICLSTANENETGVRIIVTDPLSDRFVPQHFSHGGTPNF
jgi:hypothetical protein